MMDKAAFIGWLIDRMEEDDAMRDDFISIEPLADFGIGTIEGVGAIKGNGDLLVIVVSESKFSKLAASDYDRGEEVEEKHGRITV